MRPFGAFGKAALRDDLFHRHPRARDAALHRADGAAADLGRFLVGKAARADEDQRLSLAFRKFQKATLDVGQMKAVVLPRRGRQHPVHRFLIYLPAKARAAQDGKIAVSEDRSAEHTSELQSLMRISYA